MNGLNPQRALARTGVLVAALVLAAGAAALAQPAPTRVDAPSSPAPGAAGNTPLDITNPLSVLQHAGQSLPANPRSLVDALTQLPAPAAPTAEAAPGAPAPADADGRGLSAAISILLLLTVLTLAPSILVMTTAFTRIVVVLALLRQAIGTQALPPSQVVVGLALFMTLVVMAPTFDRINREALQPLQRNEIDQAQAWVRAKEPLRDFMFAQIDHAGNWDDVYMILEYRGEGRPREELTRGDVDMLTLIPAFVLSELKVAFLMGFRLYLPFLIIDMVISSVLISMGMLMLPPVLISLPFKLLLFVLVDGWRLVVGSLLNSFAAPGVLT